MLQLKDVCKSYTTANFTQVALDHVSLAFRDNEFVAILGPSGSGKTTMLNIIGGLDHYDSGDLLIDSISTKQYRDRDWAPTEIIASASSSRHTTSFPIKPFWKTSNWPSRFRACRVRSDASEHARRSSG